MNPIEILRRARDMITNPDNWCVDMLFLDENGHRLHCVLGAINMVQYGSPHLNTGRTREHYQAVKLLDGVCVRLFGNDPDFKPGLMAGSTFVAVNNKMGHSSIMLALDTAIGDYPDHAIKEPSYQERLQGQKVTACHLDDPCDHIVSEKPTRVTATEIGMILEAAGWPPGTTMR